MNTCGEVLGGSDGYRMICGHIWCGSICQCDNCRRKDLQDRILRKQEKLLDKQLNEVKK
jgi:hypothetical protein